VVFANGSAGFCADFEVAAGAATVRIESSAATANVAPMLRLPELVRGVELLVSTAFRVGEIISTDLQSIV
jgi:hypothetical protein